MRLHTFGGLWLALDDGAPATGLSQPRRLTLLAMVASGGTQGVSRDRVLATLWPESDTERARHALAQLVYSLRRSSGGQPLLVGDSQLRLDATSLSSDVSDLLVAVQAGDHARVAELYQGSFLDGFHLTEAPDFNHWLDGERERFRQYAVKALEAVAIAATTAGDAASAADAWRRRSELDPLDPRSAAGYLEALLAAGRRTSAMQFAQKYEALVKEELNSAPDRKVRDIIDRVRAKSGAWTGADDRRQPPPAGTTSPVPVPEEAAPLTPVIPAAPARRARVPWIGGVLVGALAVALVLSWVRHRAAPTPTRVISAVAVLPFTNLGSSAEDSYLSDGLTEDLITRLGTLEGLRVAARTSAYMIREQATSVEQIGNALNVDAVIEGSVRRTGDSIRVTTRLVGTRDGFEIWTGAYDRPLGSIMKLQDEVADALVIALQRPPAATVARPPATATTDLRAYNQYLRGRYAWNRRTEEGLLSAMASFNSALALDPSYAAAAAGVASTWMLLPTYGRVPPRQAYAEARAAAQRALALDSTVVEALTVSAYLQALYDWNVQDAETGFARAVAADSQYSTAHHWRALNLVTLRRPDDARREIDIALALDPLAPTVGAAAAAVSYYGRDYAGAEASARSVLSLSPEFFPARTWLGLALLEQGRPADAKAELERAVTQSGGHWLPRAALAYTLARTGQAPAARALLTELEGQATREFVAPTNLAFVYVALGDRTAAFALLERGVAERDPAMLYLQVEPKLDNVRSDARFQAIAERTQLP